MKYYAVRKGRTTGIFLDWESCQESVKGYKGAEFKSFTDLSDANKYLKNKIYVKYGNYNCYIFIYAIKYNYQNKHAFTNVKERYL